MKYRTIISAMALLYGSVSAFAAGGGGGDVSASTRAPADPVVAAAQAAMAQKDWSGAQNGLQQALAGNPQNADYHNLYAYSIRMGPNPNMALVFEHYEDALRINPKHRAAHEYVGEAYLMVNDLPKARQHLDALNKLCFLPCEEYSDLKKAVASYEASHKP